MKSLYVILSSQFSNTKKLVSELILIFDQIQTFMNIKNPQANGLLYFLHLRLVYNRNQGFGLDLSPKTNTKPKNDHRFRLYTEA